ncbi:MAG TPA: hypothetical protein VMU34_15185 [Mycobacterium sp.]|nr:hypothetical protein [Mycobacterium sp.]
MGTVITTGDQGVIPLGATAVGLRATHPGVSPVLLSAVTLPQV